MDDFAVWFGSVIFIHEIKGSLHKHTSFPSCLDWPGTGHWAVLYEATNIKLQRYRHVFFIGRAGNFSVGQLFPL